MDTIFHELKGRCYPCNWCACTGLLIKKWFSLKFWKINFEKNKIETCGYCDGKGFLEWSIKPDRLNDFKSRRFH